MVDLSIAMLVITSGISDRYDDDERLDTHGLDTPGSDPQFFVGNLCDMAEKTPRK